MSAPTLHCSFCGQSQHDLDVLIKGPTANICLKCARDAVGVVEEERRGLRRWAVEQVARNLPSAADIIKAAAQIEGYVRDGSGLPKAEKRGSVVIPSWMVWACVGLLALSVVIVVCSAILNARGQS